ncbi:hypothetical protein FRX31_022127, partial [Thalictrum thalictroides]
MNSTLYVLFNSESVVTDGFQVNRQWTIWRSIQRRREEIKDWRHLGDYNVGYGSVLEINVINSPITIYINTSRSRGES